MSEVIKAYDPQTANKVETLLVLKQHRAKPVGETTSKRFLPGDKYQQSGVEKIEVIARGLATTDLKADVPDNPKRKAPKSPKYPKDPMLVLIEQVTKLTESMDSLVAALIEKKK